MNLVIIGFTSSGKTSVAQELCHRLGGEFVDLDRVMEALYLHKTGEELTCREIMRKHGEAKFRRLEARALRGLAKRMGMVLATGGGAPLGEGNAELLKQIGCVAYLRTQPEVIFERMEKKGLPAYLDSNPTLDGLRMHWRERDPIYRDIADCTVDNSRTTVEETAEKLLAHPALSAFVQ
jgi:shikimate kinase